LKVTWEGKEIVKESGEHLQQTKDEMPMTPREKGAKAIKEIADMDIENKQRRETGKLSLEETAVVFGRYEKHANSVFQKH
jgi:hypothetical protein